MKFELGNEREALTLLNEAQSHLEGTSGPELVRVLIARARALAGDDRGGAREVLMRARGLLDAMEARGAVLPEREQVEGSLTRTD